MEPLNKYSTAGLLVFNIFMTLWIGVSGHRDIQAQLDRIEMKVSACK